MPKYRVQMARVTWLTAHVEADDEESAIDAAHEVAPGMTAADTGWGSFGKFTADADEWLPLDEFYQVSDVTYDPNVHGLVVELETDEPAT